jgi:transcriptional regulator of acetoin/glycerol metabolism
MAGTRSKLNALLQIDEKAAIDAILAAARKTAGSVRAAARELGVSECTLHRMLRDYDLRVEFKRAGLAP